MFFSRTITAFPGLFTGFLFVGSLGYGATINFDSLANEDVVTSQYGSLATFSSASGEEIVAYDYSSVYGGSVPNFICTASLKSGEDCAQSVFVDFTNPVDALYFNALGVDDTGTVAQVNVFESDVFDTTVDVTGVASPFTPLSVDLSAFTDVTRIEIVDVTDVGGVGYDDFRFNAATSQTPEPSAFALAFAGIAGLVLRARQCFVATK
jgi:hypothetical protein